MNFFKLQFPWAVGSVFEALLALVVMMNINHEPWRWLLGFTALPMIVIIILFIVSDMSVSLRMYIATYKL